MCGCLCVGDFPVPEVCMTAVARMAIVITSYGNWVSVTHQVFLDLLVKVNCVPAG